MSTLFRTATRVPPYCCGRGGGRGGKICTRTLANLTGQLAHKVELLRRLLRDEPPLAPAEAFAIERSLPHGHVEAVLAMIRQLGVDTLLGAKRSPERNLVVAMIVERLIYPCSKLATTRLWHSTTLAHAYPAPNWTPIPSVLSGHPFRAFAGRLGLVMRQHHRAGEKLFVDYAGQTVEVLDRATGEIGAAQIFVATLGASNYT